MAERLVQELDVTTAPDGTDGEKVLDDEEAREATFFRLETLGYRVGLGLAERLVCPFLVLPFRTMGVGARERGLGAIVPEGGEGQPKRRTRPVYTAHCGSQGLRSLKSVTCLSSWQSGVLAGTPARASAEDLPPPQTSSPPSAPIL